MIPSGNFRIQSDSCFPSFLPSFVAVFPHLPRGGSESRSSKAGKKPPGFVTAVTGDLPTQGKIGRGFFRSLRVTCFLFAALPEAVELLLLLQIVLPLPKREPEQAARKEETGALLSLPGKGNEDRAGTLIRTL